MTKRPPALTRSIVIREPTRADEATTSGKSKVLAYQNRNIRAQRVDKFGGTQVFITPDIIGGKWDVSYIIAQRSIKNRPEEGWVVIDWSTQEEFEIQRTAEYTSDPRSDYLILLCQRYSPSKSRDRG